MVQQKSVKPVYLVSACLLGLPTRYDGRAKKNETVVKRLADCICVPVCPEQLGGLPTPRTAADLVGGDGNDVLAGSAQVVDANGCDLTERFIHGAEQVLAIAQLLQAEGVFLKARSPSCGLKGRTGVLAALLQKNGLVCLEY